MRKVKQSSFVRSYMAVLIAFVLVTGAMLFISKRQVSYSESISKLRQLGYVKTVEENDLHKLYYEPKAVNMTDTELKSLKVLSRKYVIIVR